VFVGKEAKMREIRTRTCYAKLAWAGLLFILGVVLCAVPVGAHELWIEVDGSAQKGRIQELHVCWGHLGSNKESGGRLKGLEPKLSAILREPDGSTEQLKLVAGEDSYTERITPAAAGYYTMGAKLESGILNEEFHGIPPSTMIMMYGKSYTCVEGTGGGVNNELGFDLEIVPVTDPKDLHPGDVVTVKVLFKGKPIGGRDAGITILLKTPGPGEPPEDTEVHNRVWSIEVRPDRDGAASFPLIAPGKHLFYARYFDETPGTYQGEVNETSERSHLRKGDTYERTLYVSTFALDVLPR